MKIQVRTIKEREVSITDPITKKPYKYIERYENGHVDELEVDLSNDVNSFSLKKDVRLIGINKDLYPLTLKSWKEVKKELSKLGLMYKFNLSKAI